MGKLLSKAGYRISGVVTKDLETARTAAEATGAERFSVCPWEVTRGADIVFITTPDDLIESTCAGISEHKGFERNAVVIHCSGALSSDILSSARDSEAVVATLHPLQSFASIDEAVSLVPGSFCTIEGDQDALRIVRQIVEDIGGILLEIEARKKTLYHAAAVATCNYLVTLIHLALELDKTAGLTSDSSYEALLPLIKGTLSNIGEKGIPGALTGPIARGDVATVSAHLKAIEKDAPKFLALYKCLGLYTVDLAKAKGTLSQVAAERLRVLLSISEERD
ncbi:MAG: DUF2520 domain-containing protein [Desulfobacterales bacterium]|nr:MAG: DUF2520 domain-containing protein [Desulfobacterales bacterium]